MPVSDVEISIHVRRKGVVRSFTGGLKVSINPENLLGGEKLTCDGRNSNKKQEL